MNLPNFFLIGAPKSGTTSLYEYVAGHPDVYMSPVKEPHYFCDDFPEFRQVTTEQQYLDLFAPAAAHTPILGEASTHYIYSTSAANNILRFNPEAKLVLMLRRPLDLVRSLYAHLVDFQLETEPTLERAWQAGPIRNRAPVFARRAPFPGHIDYQQAGMLGQHTQRLLQVVPREQLMIVLFERFRDKTPEVYRDVLSFLQLPDDGRDAFPQKNASKKSVSPRITRWLRYPPYPLSKLKQSVKRGLQRRGVRPAGRIYQWLARSAEKAPLSPSLKEQINVHFADDIKLLEQLTQLDLRHWRSPVETRQEEAEV